ncbi:hypothetical protein HRbin29_01714 [bacterium HR29]|nr:hypothetical protein HRbin29_01714 [bacterium HR29]
MVTLVAAFLLVPLFLWSWLQARNEEDGMLAQSALGLLALAGAGFGIVSWAIG